MLERMAYWLMKSEPDVFSLEHLAAQHIAGWDGVRNYQARNYLRAMRRGDQAFFYHSSTLPPAIVGQMEIVQEAYPDPTQFDPQSDHYDPRSPKNSPRWDQVDVKFVRRFARPLALDEIRQHDALQSMVLLKRGRLSVQPVTSKEWSYVLECVKE
jgi:predicted RNA-binding protein with PUA-like domain